MYSTLAICSDIRLIFVFAVGQANAEIQRFEEPSQPVKYLYKNLPHSYCTWAGLMKFVKNDLKVSISAEPLGLLSLK